MAMRMVLAVLGVCSVSDAVGVAGQEAPARVVDAAPGSMGQRSASGTVSHQSVMIWGHWAVVLESCDGGGGDAQCTVRIMNGGEVARQACVTEGQFRIGRDMDTLSASSSWTEQREGSSYVSRQNCLSLPARRAALLSMHAGSGSASPVALVSFILRQEPGDSVRVRFVLSPQR